MLFHYGFPPYFCRVLSSHLQMKLPDKAVIGNFILVLGPGDQFADVVTDIRSCQRQHLFFTALPAAYRPVHFHARLAYRLKVRCRLGIQRMFRGVLPKVFRRTIPAVRNTVHGVTLAQAFTSVSVRSVYCASNATWEMRLNIR